MKRIRRFSLEIEQRKLTLSLTQMPGRETPPESGRAPASVDTSMAIRSTPGPSLCPTCGAEWVDVTGARLSTRNNEAASFSTDAMYDALQQRGLHLQVSPGGQLSICSKSFEEVRESL